MCLYRKGTAEAADHAGGIIPPERPGGLLRGEICRKVQQPAAIIIFSKRILQHAVNTRPPSGPIVGEELATSDTLA